MAYTRKTVILEILALLIAFFAWVFIFATSGMEDPLPLWIPAFLIILCLGGGHAVKSELPDSFSRRFWPLLSLPVLVLISGIVINYCSDNALSAEVMILFVIFFSGCVPFIVSFAIVGAALRKKLVDRKWGLQTCVLITALFALVVWQRRQGLDDTLATRCEGATIDYDVHLSVYQPWNRNNRLAKLDTPPFLRLSKNCPTIDGATSFFPIYAAVVNAVYEGDRAKLDGYIRCSRTAEAYNRLIRGDVDLIFVLQPSRQQLQDAAKAGVELRFTPIAREAFVFFVNGQNPVSNLSIGQIQDIYLKKITNWRQAGGDDRRILPFQRPENSGSQTAMVEEVMKGKKLPPPFQAEYSGTMGGTVRRVAMYRDYAGSIGYSFRFFTREMVKFRDARRKTGREVTDDRVKLLSIDGVEPSEKSIRDGSYPFTADVFAVTAGTKNPHVGELIEWLISPQGQELIEKVGYVGLRETPK
ncbi:MAG: substrate-binding domain-containing protein [Synergistaceae bacterium]|jgi:phosphate transport system substrate-binding protein|nr:substrate-binding domain-containing protein [Synergistaceae bacterium]